MGLSRAVGFAAAGACLLALGAAACGEDYDGGAKGPPTATATASQVSADQAVRQAQAAEAANALPRDAFYTARPTSAAPGTLLRAEAFSGWTALPDGAHGTRILYDSRSAEGARVVTSAAVVTPGGTAPSGGWPVIAWAHGTSGVAPQCAPSLMKDLYYGDLIAAFVKQGYAVVATDYSGLGAGDGHEYNTMPANAGDVRYSVAAARKAVPQLGERWAAVGHSQGGQAAWGAAKQQATEPVGKMVGAVALAPATPAGGAVQGVIDTPGAAVYLPYVAFSLALQYDGFAPQDMLSDTGMRHYRQYVENGCLPYAIALTGDATPRAYLKADAADNAAVRRYIEKNVYTDRELAAPLFAASGAKDASVAAPTVEAAAAQQCEHGTAVAYKRYPGTHDGMIDEALPDVTAWLADRFAGKAAPSTCR
ncbi:alpha/beta hydrolase [Actinomadura parmotrematis]|uniref:Lipase family protein n=1 Tax=Actinomadura parmotrematis TaxID=2864039 RepID=A0ABS7FY19_9ACTN|nr:alpha/beta fold hydrolase [Actinomadura parmotrematis]MBW8485328.1 lipase family protein [Actinomadura parmotrematis]